MDLTTTARVKTYLGKTGSDLDATIAQLITQVSAEVEDYLDRTIQATGSDITEVLDVEWEGQEVFTLRAWPVTSVTSVKYDQDGDFASVTAFSTDEFVDPSRSTTNRGLLRLRVALQRAPLSLQVVYRGGMAASTSAFVGSYADLAGAVDAQVAFLVRRRDTIGISSVSGDGGNIAHFEKMTWLPVLKQAAKRYRRAI